MPKPTVDGAATAVMNLPGTPPLPMPPRPAPARAAWAHCLLLAATIAVVAAFLAQRWTRADWAAPWDLYDDPLEVYARVQLAGEQPGGSLLGHPAIARLGAPAATDWTAYPTPDRLVFVFTGLLARVVGVFAAAKITAVLIQIAAGLAFFACARHLRWRVEWALLGGVLFAFTSYQIRYAGTLSLSQTFTWPPLVLLCAVALRRAPLPPAACWRGVAIALGLWLGQGNPYFTYFAGYLAAATLLLAAWRRVPRERLHPLGLFLATLVATFLVAHAGYFWQMLRSDAAEFLARGHADALRYALRPIDWLIPPPEHRWSWAAQWWHERADTLRPGGVYQPAYLGLGGLAGLILLLGHTAARVARRRATLPPAALGLAAVLLLALPGGLNTLLAIAGIDNFRASQRITILVNVWALLWLGGWLHRQTRHWPRLATRSAAAVIAGFLLWEQLPHFESRARRAAVVPRWDAVAGFTQQLERELGAGASVFQLPVRPFPEAGPLGRMRDYEHFQPFLVPSSLRFSYGPLPAAAVLAWQHHVARRPAAELAAAAARQGFSAVWVHTGAYPDGGAALCGALAAAGLRELPVPANLPIRVFRLTPAARPEPIDWSDVRLKPPWSPASEHGSGASWHAGRGWYPLEQLGDRTWRWAGRSAALGVWWPPPGGAGRLRARVIGLGTQELSVRLNGEPLAQLTLPPDQPVHVDLVIPFRAGSNRLEWSIAREPPRPPGGDPRRLGFALENLAIEPVP